METVTRPGAKWKAAILAGCFAVVFASASAYADVVLLDGNNPQPNEQNVLLNTGATGALVQGTLNQSGDLINFTSNKDLTAPSNGQARVEAASGTLNVLTITPNTVGANFQDLIMNPVLSGNGQVSATAEITVELINEPSVTFSPVALGNGNNFLTLLASNDERISAVTIEITDGNEIQDVRQIRISGFAECPDCPIGRVPEPGTLAFLGGSLLGFAGLAARRLRRR